MPRKKSSPVLATGTVAKAATAQPTLTSLRGVADWREAAAWLRARGIEDIECITPDQAGVAREPHRPHQLADPVDLGVRLDPRHREAAQEGEQRRPVEGLGGLQPTGRAERVRLLVCGHPRQAACWQRSERRESSRRSRTIRLTEADRSTSPSHVSRRARKPFRSAGRGKRPRTALVRSTAPLSVAEARIANAQAGRSARELHQAEAEVARMLPRFDAARRDAAREFGRAEVLLNLSAARRAEEKGPGY